MKKVDSSRYLDVKVNVSKATALPLTGSFVSDPRLAGTAAPFHQIAVLRVSNEIALQ